MISEMIQVVEFLYAHRAPNLPPSALAEILDQLLWSLDEQGQEILRVQETWLSSDDKDRVEVALAMNQVFPFDDMHTMTTKFQEIVGRWPEFAARCAAIKEARERVEERAR